MEDKKDVAVAVAVAVRCKFEFALSERIIDLLIVVETRFGTFVAIVLLSGRGDGDMGGFHKKKSSPTFDYTPPHVTRATTCCLLNLKAKI